MTVCLKIITLVLYFERKVINTKPDPRKSHLHFEDKGNVNDLFHGSCANIEVS